MASEAEDDPVVAEYDVYLSHALPEELHVMQFPTVPRTRASTLIRPVGGRLRPEHRVLEMHVKNDDWKGSEFHAPDITHLIMTEKQRVERKRSFISDFIPARSQYCAGIFEEKPSGEKALHLVPLTGFFKMRPSLKYLHETDATLNGGGEAKVPGNGLSKSQAFSSSSSAAVSAKGSGSVAPPAASLPQQVQTNFLKPDTDKSLARKERA